MLPAVTAVLLSQQQVVVGYPVVLAAYQPRNCNSREAAPSLLELPGAGFHVTRTLASNCEQHMHAPTMSAHQETILYLSGLWKLTP
jgi:hypothetical protein